MLSGGWTHPGSKWSMVLVRLVMPDSLVEVEGLLERGFKNHVDDMEVHSRGLGRQVVLERQMPSLRLHCFFHEADPEGHSAPGVRLGGGVAEYCPPRNRVG